MAWWHTRLLFHEDNLVGVDLERLEPDASDASAATGDSLPLTAVQVSGYTLHGEVQGYYNLGVARLALDPETGEMASLESSDSLDPAQSLSSAQKRIIREWLRAQSPTAWDASLERFKRILE